MANLIVRVGAPYEIVDASRRADVAQLAETLASTDLDVQLDVIEYVPGRRGLDLVETVALFVGGGVASTLVGKITGDVYDAAKRWAQARFAKQQEQGLTRPVGFTIYGPKGEVLKQWSTQEDREAEDK